MNLPQTFAEFFVSSNIGFDTLTYWIGIADKEHLAMSWKPGIAESICSSMERQYNQEKDAVKLGGLFQARRPWQKFFKPVAPVQFAKEWSPVEGMVMTLGEPDGFDVQDDSFLGTKSLVALWDREDPALQSQLDQIPVINQDAKWFIPLLRESIQRAHRQYFVMLAAKPGGDYSRIGRPDEKTVDMMNIAQFLVQDHRPR